ncbi:unnamed protein product [Adineta ricciae]|uniref:Transposase Tc1-like domain-containing protein n=1 Tax=Adineta ricciae TaxID=249248 RepID=A0A815P9E2_ADIRI|nr:unnamed protein product [Adineta ricciae]CAF1486677.1 unnamed protein product [Adineta ricciae]
MKSKDTQTAVKNKYENGDGPTKIYRDLGGVVSLRTIKSWIQMIINTGSINLSHPPSRPRTARTEANTLKVKRSLAQKKRVSTRLLAAKISISATSARRILREDLGCFPYKKIKQSKLAHLQKRKRIKFANWALNNYTKEWVRMWMGACTEGLTVPVIMKDGTIDAERYIDEVLPIASKSYNKMLGNNSTYQQDVATPHTHYSSQKWCADHFPDFISKDRWPPNSPELCPLDYSLWNELAESMDWEHVTTKETLRGEYIYVY